MEFDHLVLGASTLTEGQEYVEDMLHVLVPRGGSHKRFGTHNCIMRFASVGYFEIIAIDPDARPEHTPRWFSLDEPAAMQQLRAEPRLLTWVVNSGSRPLNELISNIDTTPEASGTDANRLMTTQMQRGDLSWEMLIPESGRQTDLQFPWLIHWPDGQHPGSTMQDLGCELVSIVVSHRQPHDFSRSLGRIGCEDLIVVENATENAGRQQLRARVAGPDTEFEFTGLLEKEPCGMPATGL